MKKIMCLLLMLVMMFSTVCGIAEESAIDKLSEFEKSIYDALLIMLNDFKDPSSVRVMEIKGMANHKEEREAYLRGEEIDGAPDTVGIRLTGNNSFGGKNNSYFVLCYYTWNEKPRTERGKSSFSLMAQVGSKNFRYTGIAGDYYETDKQEGYINYVDIEKKIGNINRALKEHWEILGF